ncbi:MAG: hypothetical protein FWB88_03515 [Defluviitaleaceae bacterium]|nr:hypothetical protein [Defluviitaleaceae bacterium]MCL2238730.1 hypothetical protein [Defluviitaleaceae bacterium]
MSAMVADVINKIEKMDDNSARAVFIWLSERLHTAAKPATWDNIEEVEPDAIDLEMMREMENDPDCNVYVSEDEMYARLLPEGS